MDGWMAAVISEIIDRSGRHFSLRFLLWHNIEATAAVVQTDNVSEYCCGPDRRMVSFDDQIGG